MVENTRDIVRERIVYTLPIGMEYITGSSDIEALDILWQGGFELREIRELHTKLYVFDDQAFVGSANMTNKGWNVNHARPNKEVLVQLSSSLFTALLEGYRVYETQGKLSAKSRTVL